LKKSRPQHARDRTPRLIRPERKQKRRGRTDRLQISDEVRDTFTRTAIGIDIHLKRETEGHG
jgi:hypothetical protein